MSGCQSFIVTCYLRCHVMRRHGLPMRDFQASSSAPVPLMSMATLGSVSKIMAFSEAIIQGHLQYASIAVSGLYLWH